MTTILLGALGWCAISVLAAVCWATVCAGARRGEARNVPAWRQAPEHVIPAFLPSPRSVTEQSVAV